MKKLILILTIALVLPWKHSRAQDVLPHNEVNLNIANVFAVASVEVGYEYLFDYNQSIGVKLLFNDRRNYHSETRDSKFHTQSFRLNYTYYFGRESPASGFYVQPFVKYRTGNYKEPRKDNKTDMNAFMVGMGAGYEWNFSNNFVLGPFVNIARNFSSAVKHRFSAFDFNAGFNIGYRF